MFPFHSWINYYLSLYPHCTFFQIDEVYYLPEVGTVVSGTVCTGTIRVDDTLQIGPSETGEFQVVTINSIHRNCLNSNVILAGQAATLSIAQFDDFTLRKVSFTSMPSYGKQLWQICSHLNKYSNITTMVIKGHFTTMTPWYYSVYLALICFFLWWGWHQWWNIFSRKLLNSLKIKLILFLFFQGQVLLSQSLPDVTSCLEFEAYIYILSNSNCSMSKGYETIIHIGNVCQPAKVIWIEQVKIIILDYYWNFIYLILSIIWTTFKIMKKCLLVFRCVLTLEFNSIN